jgi:hypothetical protein
MLQSLSSKTLSIIYTCEIFDSEKLTFTEYDKHLLYFGLSVGVPLFLLGLHLFKKENKLSQYIGFSLVLLGGLLVIGGLIRIIEIALYTMLFLAAVVIGLYYLIRFLSGKE